jgi:hypothetical protein
MTIPRKMKNRKKTLDKKKKYAYYIRKSYTPLGYLYPKVVFMSNLEENNGR